jgi:hypothetical protein
MRCDYRACGDTVKRAKGRDLLNIVKRLHAIQDERAGLIWWKDVEEDGHVFLVWGACLSSIAASSDGLLTGQRAIARFSST